MVATSEYFEIVKPRLFFQDVSKSDFKVRKRVLISSLCPNQKLVDYVLIERKMKGRGLTSAYVLFYNGYNILMDGHHSVIARKLNGQKYVLAYTLELKTTQQ